ncbi:MAG: thioredoxin domain-containing protein [Chitinispirillaceae bacterium]|nr:thioredoxin domain-containing protein [Chitinispirillaceae bacterium]
MIKPYGFFRTVCLLALAGFFSAFSSERRNCAGLDSVTIQECGTLSIHECSKKNPECAIAHRLDTFIRWIDTIKGDNGPCSTKVTELKKRYETFKDTLTFSIDMSEVRCVGADDAPITILLYITASCPLCKKVYRELHEEVTEGKLRGAAKLGIKVFGVRPNDVAVLAAGKLNRQSDLLLALGEVKERLSEKIIIRKAHEIGMPDSAFRELIRDSACIKMAQASALEGTKNGVTVTPTVFINNKRYSSYKDPQWIVDAALFEYESFK